MKNTDIEIITSIKALFTTSKKKLVIIPHESPDGDAIGSAMGLGQVLQNFGHEVRVLSSNDYPGFLKWFSAEVPVMIYDCDKKEAKNWLKEVDAMICLDFNEPKRAGRLEKKILAFAKKKVMIDHHPFPSSFADYMVSETSYSSTAELVVDVLSATGLNEFISKNAAEALYTGIMTDTGGFSHNFSKNTFKVVSELLNMNIDTDKIQSAVYHNFSADRMKLLGFCLNERMQVFPEYRAAMISIRKEDLERFNFQPGDTEGFVNYPLSIKDIVFSALFIEKGDHVKASFRSKGNFPVNAVSAAHFNGGGHLNAAGGESDLNFEETILKFTQLLPEYKHQLLDTTI